MATSARTRPINHENLKPCPLRGPATMTADRTGRKTEQPGHIRATPNGTYVFDRAHCRIGIVPDMLP
jgi:hypothetical protein